MLDVLFIALIIEIIIGVLFWAAQQLLDLIPINPIFARLVNIIIVLMSLLVAYKFVVLPLANNFGIHLPSIG